MAGSKARAPSIPAKVKLAIRALLEHPTMDLQAAANAATVAAKAEDTASIGAGITGALKIAAAAAAVA
jgi:hypothetical protein